MKLCIATELDQMLGITVKQDGLDIWHEDHVTGLTRRVGFVSWFNVLNEIREALPKERYTDVES